MTARRRCNGAAGTKEGTPHGAEPRKVSEEVKRGALARDAASDLDIEIGQRHVGRSGDVFEPPTDDVQRVLGGEQQHAARLWDGEAAPTRLCGEQHDQPGRREASDG